MQILQDLSYAVRTLRKKPGFTFVVIITLAVGIGVNAALFSVFDALVLRPLPLKDPDSLVSFEGVNSNGERRRLFSYSDYLNYRDQNSTLSDVIAWNKVRATLGEPPPLPNDEAFAEGYEYLFGQMVSGNYFTALGAEMAQGRAFRETDYERPGKQQVIVLSHGFWQRRFETDSAIVGKTINLQGQPFTVIGVTSREFIGTTPDTPSFWTPLMMRDTLIQAGGWEHKRWLTDPNSEVFSLLGRLKPGVTRDDAENEMQLIAGRLAQSYPDHDRVSRVTLARAGTFVTLDEDLMPLVIPLLIGFGLVLLIACANVANLFLAQAAGRQRELGVRLAMGASRWRIVRQLVTESLLLAIAGGALGLLLAVWTLSLLYPIVLSSIPLPQGLADGFSLSLRPDWRIFGFTLFTATVAGIGAGLAPALQASKPDLSRALKDEGSTFGRHLSQSRLRSGLVVAQIAVCMALLVAAGLLVRNLQRLRTIDTGMNTKNVFSVAASLKNVRAPVTDQNGAERDAAHEPELRRQLADRMRVTPGVVSVAHGHEQPLSGQMGNTLVDLPGQTVDRPVEVRFNFVSPEYFEALSIQFSRGRPFTTQEVNGGTPVIVISEATAKRFWPGADPLGKHLGVSAGADQPYGDAPTKAISFRQYEVIGVTRDTRSRWIWETDKTFLYLPLPPSSGAGQFLIVRTQDDPATVMNTVRGAATEIDPLMRISVRRLEETLAFQMAPFRAIAWLSAVLGALALLLASVGLYGVMSFVVTQRTREIGIRVALGANPLEVLRMFLSHGLRLAAVGIVCGVVAAALISRLLAAVLIDLSTLDPLTFGGVSVFLIGVTLLATIVPARRATKVDPMVALRYE